MVTKPSKEVAWGGYSHALSRGAKGFAFVRNLYFRKRVLRGVMSPALYVQVECSEAEREVFCRRAEKHWHRLNVSHR